MSPWSITLHLLSPHPTRAPGSASSLLKRGLSRGAHHCPGGEDLHYAGLGALAAGLIVLHHEVAGQLPGDVGEAAGGRWVRANCGGQRWSSAVARDGEKGISRSWDCSPLSPTSGEDVEGKKTRSLFFIFDSFSFGFTLSWQ